MCEELITAAAPGQGFEERAWTRGSVCCVPSADLFQLGAAYQALLEQPGADRASES